MNLPIYLRPDVPFSEIGDCSQFQTNGKKIDQLESLLKFEFDNNGKAVLRIGGLSTNITPHAWSVAQNKKLHIKLHDDDGNLKIGLRKFTSDSIDEETIEEVPLEDIVIETIRLENVEFDPRLFTPIKTNKYLDKFWSRSGGILPATNIMITGDPGIGKSSNLMDILVGIVNADINKRVLYISAEMSRIDVQEFLQFYPGLEKIDFLFLGEYVTDPNQKIKAYQALQSTLDQGWDVVVLDSLYETQGMIQEDLEINSFKKGERYMLDLFNKHNSGHNKLNLYTSFLAIQQKNKSGQYVGSKRLEHMTTGFLQLLWDPKERGKRYMIFEKNRKGKEKVKLYYNLSKEKGIVYDEVRHTKELEFMEILQQSNGMGLEELDQVDFESIFAAKKEND